ncbi:MAG: hypothetical protein ABL940_10145, partial [Bacteroidia bacterium]
FIGTTDDVNLVFKRNKIQSGLIDSALANTAFGYRTLIANTTGYRNTAIGYTALGANTTGFQNTGVGVGALFKTTTGSSNTALGSYALNDNTTGNNNIGVGFQALTKNTIGGSNTAIGIQALALNISGGRNIAMGNQAMYNNTIGNYNVAMGDSALFTTTNSTGTIAIGTKALLNNTTGVNNLAIGFKALEKNTTGVNNFGIGSYALGKNIIGGNNVAFGYNTLPNNLIGTNNIAIGTNALQASDSGNSNIAIGTNTLYNNKKGYQNTAIGTNTLFSNTKGYANTAIGPAALYSNTSGIVNVALGLNALNLNTTGSYNVAVGTNALISNTTGSYNVTLGTTTLYRNTTGNNSVAIGNSTLLANTTGRTNTSIGASSMIANSTGNNNVALGSNTLFYMNQSQNTALGDNSFLGNFSPLVAGAVSAPATNVDTVGNKITITAHGFTPSTHMWFQITSTGTVPAPLTNGGVYFGGVQDANTIGLGTDITTLGTGTITLTPHDTDGVGVSMTNSTAIGYNSKPTLSNQIQLGDTRIQEVRTRGNLIPHTDLVQNIGEPAHRWDTIFARTVVTSASLALGTTANDVVEMNTIGGSNVNNSQLQTRHIRTEAGADWFTAGTRIQQKIDNTWMGYMQFNGNGSNNGGISFGTGQTTVVPGNVPEKMRITSAGNVGIGTTAPETQLNTMGEIRSGQTTGAIHGKISLAANVTTGGSTKGTTVHTIFGPYNSPSGTTGALYIGAGASADGTKNDIIMYQTGGGNVNTIQLLANQVGINTSTPAATLDVNGVALSNYEGFSYYTTGTAVAAAWQTVVIPTLDYNTFAGTPYNTVLGEFTAPRAGFYRFTIGGYSSTPTTGADLRYAMGVSINGTLKSFTGGNYSAFDTPMATYTQVIKLAVGDKIKPNIFSSIAATLGSAGVGHIFTFQGEFVGK